MPRPFKSGRAPALIASSLVLAGAIGGTAIAASSGGGSEPKTKAHEATVKRTVDREIRRLAPKEIRKIAPRLHVAFAKNSGYSGRSASALAADNANSVKKTGVVSANVGQRVNLLTVGPFTFSLLCRQGVSTASPAEGSVVGEIDVVSTEDKAAIETSSTSQAAEFPAGSQFPLTDRSTSTNPKTAPDEPNFDGDGGFFTALAPSGTVVSGDAYVGTHILGHDCVGGLFALS
jgi:hypothetical protein